MPREQASGLAEAQRESLAEVLNATLATKSDISTMQAMLALNFVANQVNFSKYRVTLNPCYTTSRVRPYD